MADLYEVSKGISITNDEDVLVLDILSSSGAPGLTTEEDAAPRGSFATDNLTGDLYTKITAGTGTVAWTKIATLQDVLNNVVDSPWKVAAKVADSTAHASLAAAETALNTGTVDGVTISAGDRVLLTDVTGSDDGIYEVTGTPGSGATYTLEEAPADGDTVYTQEGTTNGDNTYTYNGTVWVQSNAGSSAELAFIRAYIGKIASGSELPDYTTNNYVLDNDTLVTAISKLDAALGITDANVAALTTTVTTLQTEVDAIETSAGSLLNSDGTWNGFSGTGLLDGATSLTDALETLDTTIAANSDDADIRAFIGKSAAGTETPDYSSEVHITDGDDLETSIGKLDAAIAKQNTTITIAAHLGTTIADSVLVDDFCAVEWHICAKENGTQNTRIVFTHGGHNGTPTADATDTDRSEFARLRMGNVNGFRTRVILNGTGATQTMDLELRTNNACDVKIVRKTLF